MGALHKLIPLGVDYDQTLILVKDVAEAGQWNERYIRNLLPQNLVEYILHKINPPKYEEESNRPYWKLESTGKFTMTSAFHHIRQRQEVNKVYNYIWTKGMPIKISFFMWKLWKAKVPLDDTLRRWGIQFPSRCYCCEDPKTENRAHVFLQSSTAQMV